MWLQTFCYVADSYSGVAHTMWHWCIQLAQYSSFLSCLHWSFTTHSTYSTRSPHPTWPSLTHDPKERPLPNHIHTKPPQHYILTSSSKSRLLDACVCHLCQHTNIQMCASVDGKSGWEGRGGEGRGGRWTTNRRKQVQDPWLVRRRVRRHTTNAHADASVSYLW